MYVATFELCAFGCPTCLMAEYVEIGLTLKGTFLQ